MSEVYAITDLEGYAKAMRLAVSNSFSNDYSENINDFITINQMVGLVHEACLGYDTNDNPIIDEETNDDIFEYTRIWIQNVGLAKLAAQNIIECAWDEDNNTMVFWYPSKNNGDECHKIQNK